jgi:hypothetical protein
MNKLAQDLMTQLARKDTIDINNQHANNMTSYTRWVVDAVELLLRAELERQKHADTPR